jgi:cellulose synthase/poly-beta-1,6-N-acetylglucosamine synthase-like glycosyltransferase
LFSSLLEPAARVDPRYIETAHVREVYRSRRNGALTVVDKENGGKADALNAALNFAENPLVCAVDADAILEPDALLRVVKPFLDDPADVAAVGGIIRIANGCTIEDGRVVDIRLPRSHLVGLQVMEYLRAYLIGRTGWSEVNGLLIISGAFGLFRRDAVLAAGGYDTTTVGEDAELVVRLHRRYQEAGRPYRIAFVPDPVCWTEAPESLRVLGRQRRRWQRGLWQTLSRHRRMAFDPRYGVPGTLAYPYQLLFEAFGPLVEAFGYVTLLVSVLLGLLDVEFAVLFLTIAVLYGWLVSSASVLLEEVAFRRYRTWSDIARLLAYALFENAGYRQLHTWWRLTGIVDVFRGGVSWGDMERRGLGRGPTGPG